MQREAAACGQADAGRFWKVASRIAGSPAFMRLRRITFLGILSPAFKDLPGFPVTCRGQAASADGTRADHSFAVALLAHGIAVRLGLSGAAADHAAAWGLLHDIAAWPLSHTGEAAFSASTGTDARGLRRMMVLGSDSLPPELSLHASLKAAGIDTAHCLRCSPSARTDCARILLNSTGSSTRSSRRTRWMACTARGGWWVSRCRPRGCSQARWSAIRPLAHA